MLWAKLREACMGQWNTPGIYKGASCYHKRIRQEEEVIKIRNCFSHRRRWPELWHRERNLVPVNQRRSQGISALTSSSCFSAAFCQFLPLATANGKPGIMEACWWHPWRWVPWSQEQAEEDWKVHLERQMENIQHTEYFPAFILLFCHYLIFKKMIKWKPHKKGSNLGFS